MTKKDNQRRQGVSSPKPSIGEPRSQAQQPPQQSVSHATGNDSFAGVSVTLSARYIDSRMKQFCLR